MGFASIGFLLAVIMLIPSVLCACVLPPRNVPKKVKYNNVFFTIIERLGQIGCIAALVLSKDSFDNAGLSIWFFLMMAMIVFYYVMWIRHFTGGREFKTLFKRFYFIPMPIAVSGVLVFVLAAVWIRSVWLGASAAVFAAGHFASCAESLKKAK